MTVGWSHVLIGLVVLQRLAELAYAGRNARALLASGGRETGRGHYPLFFLLQGSWLVALSVFAPAGPPDWMWLGVFLVLQLLRLWVIRSLGRYWTTRIITLEGVPPVRSGPYRYLRHPNYLVVAIEIPAFSMALRSPVIAAVFGILNVALLLHRMRIEDTARQEL